MFIDSSNLHNILSDLARVAAAGDGDGGGERCRHLNPGDSLRRIQDLGHRQGGHQGRHGRVLKPQAYRLWGLVITFSVNYSFTIANMYAR